MASNDLIGAFIFARHGDRQGYYGSPSTYTATSQELTPLGQAQAFNLGALLRSRYLSRSSATFLSDVNPDLYQDGQSVIKSDMGSESSININTATGITQGIWPATRSANTTLADGTYVISPLNGYQYVPIETVDPYSTLYLEGSLNCNTFSIATSQANGLPDFLTQAQENADFLESLQQYVGGRPTTFGNIYKAWDFLNVNDIHNATFHQLLPRDVLAKARGLADWYSYYTYSSAEPTDILNINAHTFIPEIMSILGRIGNRGDSLKFAVYTGSYKPFLSLFAMLGVTRKHPELAGIVNYAGAISLEVRQPAGSSTMTVRFNFKNGTADADFKPYPMFGHAEGDYDISLAEFNLALQSYGVPDALSWCNVCNNTIDRTCDVAVQASYSAELLGKIIQMEIASVTPGGGHGMSATLAGVIGAIVALAVAGLLVLLLLFFGFISWNRKNGNNSHHHRRNSSIPQIVVRMAKGKRESGDSESTRGVIKNPGDFEMMPDFSDNVSVLSHMPEAVMKV